MEQQGVWATIKAVYWSPIGLCTTALHVATAIVAILTADGFCNVWYGDPLIKWPQVKVEKGK